MTSEKKKQLRNRFKTPEFILHYPHLFEPTENYNKDGFEYNVKCLVPKDDEALVSEWRELEQKHYDMSKEMFGQRKQDVYFELVDCDVEVNDDGIIKSDKDETLKGMYSINLKKKDSKWQPFYVEKMSADGDKVRVLDPSAMVAVLGNNGKRSYDNLDENGKEYLYAGARCVAVIDSRTFEAKGKCGATKELSAIKKVADGQRLQGMSDEEFREKISKEREEEAAKLLA